MKWAEQVFIGEELVFVDGSRAALACGILGALATYNSAFNQWPLRGVAALWKRHPHRRILSRKVKVRV